MKLKTTKWDAAEYLDSQEAIAIFMAEAFKTNDPAYIAHALGVVARAKGMAQIAKKPASPASSFIAPSAKTAIPR